MAVIPVVSRIWTRSVLAVVLLYCSPSLLLAVEFVEFYKNGIAAVETQQWNLAAEMMRKAISQQPEAKTRVKKALYFRRYLPHFYLGKALYETGDCTGAMAAWQESENQGVVERFPEYQQIVEGRLACGQMVDLESALDEALRAVEAAEVAATQSRRRLSGVPESQAGFQTLVSRQSEAEASLARVRGRLASPDMALSEVEEAATLAAVTRREFEGIRQQADELRAEVLADRQQELTTRIEDLIVQARRALRDSEYLQPYPANLARNRSAVEQALKHAQAASDGTLSAGELQAVQTELARSTSDLRRSASPPPKDLERAAEAYLVADYAGVVTILADAEFSATRAAYHSHLLQAAALFSLYHSTGASDDELLERAGLEVLACRGVDGDLSLPSAVFSPRFVSFYENQIQNSDESSESEGVEEGL